MKTHPPISRQVLVAIGLLALVAVIAVLGSLATIPNTDGWYKTVEKVAWNPPNEVFGPAWSFLYLLIALAGWLVWRSGWREGERNAAQKALKIYAAQLVLNGIWTPVFFAAYPAIGEAAWWVALAIIIALIATVVWLIGAAWKWSKMAAIILIPYLLWLTYASTLNAGIIVLN